MQSPSWAMLNEGDDIFMEVTTRDDVENLVRCSFRDEGWTEFCDGYSFDHDGDADADDILFWVDNQVEFGELDRSKMFERPPESLT